MKLKPAPKRSFSILAVTAYGDILAVAADWRQASCEILAYGGDGWNSTGFQVAEFRHSARQALAQQIREHIAVSEGVPSDEVDVREVESVLSRAEWVVT